MFKYYMNIAICMYVCVFEDMCGLRGIEVEIFVYLESKLIHQLYKYWIYMH